MDYTEAAIHGYVVEIRELTAALDALRQGHLEWRENVPLAGSVGLDALENAAAEWGAKFEAAGHHGTPPAFVALPPKRRGRPPGSTRVPRQQAKVQAVASILKAQSKPKRIISAAGRKRIAAGQKKRWAAYRKAKRA